MGEIFSIIDQQTLVSLKEHAYESEDLLQTLLAKYPSLLAGDQINPKAPRKWLLVKREVEVPDEEGGSGRWSIDHLFLDQEGVPTLVEVKRSTDTRIRREVVGQMLDYAANGVKYWPMEEVRSFVNQRCEREAINAYTEVDKLTGVDNSWEQFWATVKLNLQAGRIRMIFVADEIPEELRRVVEFLNKQMDPAEVLAIEIKPFVGQNIKTLVPRLIGQTSEAEERKGVSGSRSKRQWDEASYFSEMEVKNGPLETRIARRVLEWANSNVTRIWWGQGAENGSFIPVLEVNGEKFLPIALYHEISRGRPAIEINFQYAYKKSPFDQLSLRLEWLRRLNEIPGVSLPADVIERRPNFPLLALDNEAAMAKFLSAMNWFVSEARKGCPAVHEPI